MQHFMTSKKEYEHYIMERGVEDNENEYNSCRYCSDME